MLGQIFYIFSEIKPVGNLIPLGSGFLNGKIKFKSALVSVEWAVPGQVFLNVHIKRSIRIINTH